MNEYERFKYALTRIFMRPSSTAKLLKSLQFVKTIPKKVKRPYKNIL